MTILPWSNPLFRPKKGRFAIFFEATNGGISTNNTSLHLLPWRTPRWTTAPSDGLTTLPNHLWTCPPTSPCSAGLVCPVMLYEEKITSPMRHECLQATRPQQHSFPPGKEPNHRQSARRNLQRSAPSYSACPSFAPQRKRGTLGWL
jgi:hypothetical protein